MSYNGNAGSILKGRLFQYLCFTCGKTKIRRGESSDSTLKPGPNTQGPVPRPGLSPRVPELGSEPSEKGLLGPFPKKKPPNRPSTAPPPISQMYLGNQEQLPSHPKRPGSEVHSNAGAGGPLLQEGSTTVAAGRAGEVEGVFAFSQRGLFACQNEKGEQTIRLQRRCTKLLQRGGQQMAWFRHFAP